MKRVLVLLSTILPAVLGAVHAIHAATYQYGAETLAPARKQGAVSASGINWNCQGTRCSVSGPWATPAIAACNALAKQVGPLRNYGHTGSMLSPGELQQCNAGVSTIQSTGLTTTLPHVTKPIPPQPDTKPPSTPGTTPSAAHAQKRTISADDFARLASPIPEAPYKVAPLTPHVNASGPQSSTPPQTPIIITASQLRYTGQGPVVINADPLRYEGEGPVVITASTLSYMGQGRKKPGTLAVVVNADTLRYAGQGPVVINADILRYTGQGPVVINADVLRYSGAMR